MTIRIAVLLSIVFGVGFPVADSKELDTDLSKGKIEQPAKAIVADAVAPVPKRPLDAGKSLIESQPKRMLVEAADKTAKESSTDQQAKKVSPGKVQWHKDYAAAVEKSKLSNKPVLLFQLLGQLDEEFT